MAGQIVERRKGVYTVRVFIGRDGANKRKYENQTVHGAKKDAQTVLTALLRAKDMGELVRPAKMSFGQHAENWMITVVEGRVRGRTFSDYRGILDRYLLPAFGAVPLGQITPEAIQKLYAGLKAKRRRPKAEGETVDKGAKKGRTGAFLYAETSEKLSSQTARHIHAVLSSALKQAVRWRLILSNPCDLVDLPKVQRDEKAVLGQDDAVTFLSKAKGKEHYEFFALLLATGMRPGEALALRWCDIDLAEGYVSINRALSGSGANVRFEEPKTPRSRRRVPLPGSVLELLRAMHDERVSKADGSVIELELLFSRDGGRPLDLPNLARRHFRPILKEAGLPQQLRIYDLRHSCATLLLQGGTNPKIVSERLGHASVMLTLDTYSHVLPDMQESAAAKLEEMLFTKKPAVTQGAEKAAAGEVGTP